MWLAAPERLRWRGRPLCHDGGNHFSHPPLAHNGSAQSIRQCTQNLIMRSPDVNDVDVDGDGEATRAAKDGIPYPGAS